MSEEQDSWFKDAFGLDLGQAAQKIKDEAAAAANQVASTVTQVVQGVQGVVNEAIDGATGAVTGVVKKIAGAAGVGPGGGGGAGASGGSAGGGTGKFPLGGSVGRGGKNAPGDVRAVQAALGIAVDGQCGGQTIAAIEAFQRNHGLPKADGRVDPGGATERAMTGGGKGAASPKGASGQDDSDDLLGKALAGAQGIAGALAGGLAGPAGLPGKAIELGRDLGGALAGGLPGGLLGDVSGDLGGALGVLPELPPPPAPNFDDDPNTVFAGEHFRMKMLEGLSFGEIAGLTTFTFVIWDVDNNRAATYEYASVIVTLGTPITFTGEGDWSDVFTTRAMQVDQFSCNASHGAVGALNLGAMVMNLDAATVNVPTGFSKGGGFEAGGGFFSMVGSVQVFKGP